MQAAVGPRWAGRAREEFEYLAPQVLRSRWGDLEVVANLTSRPWTVDAETALAPEGFTARSPHLEAGIFLRHAGDELGPGGTWLIRQRRAEGWSEWSAEPEGGW